MACYKKTKKGLCSSLVLSETGGEAGNSYWESTNKVGKCWIKKHSYCKGTGLSVSSDSVAVWEI